MEAEAVLRVQLQADTVDMGLLLHQPPPAARAVATPAAMSVRQSISAALIQMAAIRPGDLVLDPMVGGGSLAVEATESPHSGCVLGGEISPDPARLASANLRASRH